ncbi:hypothetical protein ACMA1I_22725 [Pontibacter sp. 13R65]|uniref:hypothetical protein n=1 Tax=Pontibacter sp. 13R65 TaxID=3127458 RepID=UPI00301D3519
MKGSFVLLFLMAVLGSSCGKQETIALGYIEGKIIKATCGGTVIQVLSDRNIGETWPLPLQGQPETFHNVVLAGNVPQERQVEGDTLLFTYETVTHFSGNNYCEIGGLPRIKIEILRLKP